MIDFDDPEYSGVGVTHRVDRIRGFHRRRRSGVPWQMPEDEWDANLAQLHVRHHRRSQGVVYHHRGAYLLAVGNVVTGVMGKHTGLSLDAADVPLQRLVLHLVALGAAGTHVCLRAVRGAGDVRRHRHPQVTHLCGAPIVMSTLLNAPPPRRNRCRMWSSSHGRVRRRRKRCSPA